MDCATELGFRKEERVCINVCSDFRGFGKGGCLEVSLRELALKSW